MTLDRRAVVRTAGWTVPVIVASAVAPAVTPAFAVSGDQLDSGVLRPVAEDLCVRPMSPTPPPAAACDTGSDRSADQPPQKDVTA